MRIAIVAPEVFPIPPIRGGAVEAGIHEVAKRLDGHDVHVLGIADPELPLTERDGHIRYRRFRPSRTDRWLLSTYKLPFKRSSSRWYYWPYARWAAAQLSSLQPDLVSVKTRMQFVPWLRRAVPRAKIILGIHQLSSLTGASVWSEPSVACCDAITGCSRFVVDTLHARYPVTRPKTRVLYNGVDVQRFQPWWTQAEARTGIRHRLGANGGPVVLYTGRLVEQKGVHVLAEAFRAVATKWASARLVIAGSHTYSNETETPYVRRLKAILAPVGQRVRWCGFVPRKDMPALYAGSDLLVQPSVGPEAFSNTILEAMASGLPVVAFAHGGSCEVVRHEETGLLVELGQGGEGLGRALDKLLGDAASRRRLGREARRVVEQELTWEVIAERTRALYEELVRADGHRAVGG